MYGSLQSLMRLQDWLKFLRDKRFSELPLILKPFIFPLCNVFLKSTAELKISIFHAVIYFYLVLDKLVG